jgi:tRNA(Arg) A34 adenosine deaminase TadA
MTTEIQNKRIFSLLMTMAETVEPVGDARIASAIVLKNDVISFGINKRKSHPFQKKYGKNEDAIYLHAEIDAIKNALRHIEQEELSRASLYVARVKRSKSQFVQGLAKPCAKGCCKAIAAFGIKNVYYTTNTQGIYECL